MRKFADKEQRTDVSTTESTLILSGYSRELANKKPFTRYYLPSITLILTYIVPSD